MAKRLSIEEVKDRIIQYSNGNLEYYSGDYKNQRSKLQIRCKCGNIFERTLERIRYGQILCPECSRKSIAELQRNNIEDIKEYAKDHDCEYISGKYLSNKSLLLFKCSCGNFFEKSFSNFQKGQDHCPSCGLTNSSQKRRKYSHEEALEIFEDYGYKLLDHYEVAHGRYNCICPNGHNCKVALTDLLLGARQCATCASEEKRGSTSPTYKGGTAIISSILRKDLAKWKKDILENYDYICPITNSKDVVVHHLISFNEIYYSVLDRYNLDIPQNKAVNTFPSEKIFDQIRNEIKEMHNDKTGIVISKDLHLAFHSRYGRGSTTPQQFDDFIQKKYHISLLEIQK